MVRHYADDRRRVFQRFGEDISEEINGMGQDVGIITNEDQFILKHHERPYI